MSSNRRISYFFCIWYFMYLCSHLNMRNRKTLKKNYPMPLTTASFDLCATAVRTYVAYRTTFQCYAERKVPSLLPTQIFLPKLGYYQSPGKTLLFLLEKCVISKLTTGKIERAHSCQNGPQIIKTRQTEHQRRHCLYVKNII